MKTDRNPFYLEGYYGSTYFCDREEETTSLLNNAKNGINTTLLSVRRMGKTGLIHHVFKQLERDKSWKGIYIDIYATQSLSQFTEQIASAILKVFPHHKSFGKKFIDLIKGFSPSITYDPLTGVPEVSFNYHTTKQSEYSLKELFNFLDQQAIGIVIAIDEFQQIANYPEKNIEAILRTIVQRLKNVSFIFSGSHKHMLIEMFNNVKRPFFSSTQSLFLQEISRKKYSAFIERLFKKQDRSIEKEAIIFILDWTKVHTYYTQAVCNKVYAQNKLNIKLADVYNACDTILREQENIFFQYRNLLTSGQWELLEAIGKEDIVVQPTSNNFISKYHLGNPASVRRSLQALVDKEMVMREVDKDGQNSYQVYNCFLSRWLQRL